MFGSGSPDGSVALKTLFLLRHAKSDWHGESPDHERTLAPRGHDAAQRIGRFLSEIGQLPERVVSSTAVRARETVRLAALAGEWSTELELDSNLYDTSAERMLEWLHGVDDTTNSVLLAGHQPTWSLLAGGLIGGGQIRFPTAALARIDLHIERWRDVDFGCGELVWFQLPRLLKGIGWPVSTDLPSGP